jgi:hypothetical protein
VKWGVSVRFGSAMGVVVCRALVGLKGGPNNAGGGGLR